MTVKQACSLWGDNATFRRGPRQNGKTTQALKDAAEIKSGVVFFCPTVSMMRNIKYVALRAVGHTSPFPIVSIGDTLDRLRGRHDDTWFFDEYSHMNDDKLGAALDHAAMVGVKHLVFIGE